MHMLKALFDCLTGSADVQKTKKFDADEGDHSMSIQKEDRIASDILHILLTAEKPGYDLRKEVKNTVSISGWYDGIAKRILDRLVRIPKA